MLTEIKSRNVRGYIKLFIKLQDLKRKLRDLEEEVNHKRNHLTGGQWGQAQRILKEMGY